jgi:hypothetical protein
MSLIDNALWIREQSELFLVDSCIIKVFNGFATVDGEYSESFTDSGPTPCRLINKSGKVAGSANATESLQLLTSQTTLRIQLPYNTLVSTKDKIVFNSTTYDVTYVPEKHSLMGAFIVSVERQK